MRLFATLAFAIGCVCATSTAQAQQCFNVGDGVCDEPGYGTGHCEVGTDTADCSIDQAKRIGVLATSESGNGSAVLWTSGSIPDAQLLALSDCGVDCTLRVTLTFASCIGYARSKADGAWGWAYAPTLGEAETSALSWCQDYGGQACRVLVSQCGG